MQYRSCFLMLHVDILFLFLLHWIKCSCLQQGCHTAVVTLSILPPCETKEMRKGSLKWTVDSPVIAWSSWAVKEISCLCSYFVHSFRWIKALHFPDHNIWAVVEVMRTQLWAQLTRGSSVNSLCRWHSENSDAPNWMWHSFLIRNVGSEETDVL